MAKREETRPKLPIERPPLELALIGVALLGLAAQLGLVGLLWRRLPEEVPMHFDFAGRPDRWGGRWTLLLLPLVTAVMLGLLEVVGRFPQSFNYPWPITPENAARQYALARGMMVALGALLAWLFLGILAGTCWAALGGGRLPAWIPLLGVAAMMATVAGYFVLASRAR